MTTLAALQHSLTPQGAKDGDAVVFLQNVRDAVNDLSTLVTALRVHTLSRAFAKSGLAIGGTTTSYKHTTQVAFIAGGLLQLSATTADHAFTAANTITQDTWGVWLVTLASTTWKTTPAATAMAYTTEALAIAAMPAPPANEAVMGYITIRARSTATFTANTTNLTADNGSTNAQTVNYYDGGLADMPALAALSAAALTLAKG